MPGMTDEDAWRKVASHYKQWAMRAKMLSNFAGLERALDISIMLALSREHPDEPFARIILARLNAVTKIDILRDILKAKGLLGEFKALLAEVDDLRIARNAIAHAAIARDVEDPIGIMLSGGKDALIEAVREARDVATNYGKKGAKTRAMESNAEIEALQKRIEVAHLGVLAAGVRTTEVAGWPDIEAGDAAPADVEP